MKNILKHLAALTAVILCGCVHNPPRNVPPMVIPLRKADDAVIEKRVSDFLAVTSKLQTRGVWLHPKAFAGVMPNEEVIRGIKRLGFNRVYCALTSETELDDQFAQFVWDVSASGLDCEIVVQMFNFYHRKRGNILIRHIVPPSPDLKDIVETLVFKFRNDTRYARLAGITLFLTPHRFVRHNPDPPEDIPYHWNSNSSTGLDYNWLMDYTIKLVGDLPKFDPRLTLSVSLPDFYYQLVKEGKLRRGLLRDFVNARPDIYRFIIVSYGSKPSEMSKNMRDGMAEAVVRDVPALLEIELAPHASEANTRLRDRGWDDMVKALDYNLNLCGKYEMFGGIVLGPYSRIETILLEK